MSGDMAKSAHSKQEKKIEAYGAYSDGESLREVLEE